MMKLARVVPIGFCVVAMSSVGWGQTEYGRYEFSGTSTADNQFNQPTSQASYASFSDFTRTNIGWTSTTNVFNSSSWNTTATRDDAEFVGFSVTLNGSNTFLNNQLTLKFSTQRSTTGPTSGEVMYRYGSNAFASAGSWSPPTIIAQSSIAIPVPGNTTEYFVEFRFHGMSATSGSGTLRFDDVIVEAPNVPLPIEMAKFGVDADGVSAHLSWSTASEVNNYGFEIERTAVSNQQSAVSWQRVGFVAGSGTSSAQHEYSYSDRNLAPGRYAYRLKQLDNDGTFSYSGSAEIEIGLAPNEFKLEPNFPNPFNPSTTIEFTLGMNGHASLRVYNVLGQEVAMLFDGEAQAGRVYPVKFDASRLPSGLYFAKLEAGKQQTMRKMLLVK